MIYNVRNDFDEWTRKKGSDERKYRKKRLHNFIELYGEERIDVENGTAKNLYFDTMRQKNSFKDNIKKSKNDQPASLTRLANKFNLKSAFVTKVKKYDELTKELEKLEQGYRKNTYAHDTAFDGGEGSGNFNHAGRPGKIGGIDKYTKYDIGIKIKDRLETIGYDNEMIAMVLSCLKTEDNFSKMFDYLEKGVKSEDDIIYCCVCIKRGKEIKFKEI